MKLATTYSTALKYAMADQEGIEHWLKLASDEDSVKDNISHPDHFFADWLEDRDDPRHLILRKDLEIRKQPGEGWGDKESRMVRERVGDNVEHSVVRPIPFGSPKDELYASKKTGTKGTNYKVVWAPHDKSFAPSIGYLPPYISYFTPEEFQDFLHKTETGQSLKDCD